MSYLSLAFLLLAGLPAWSLNGSEYTTGKLYAADHGGNGPYIGELLSVANDQGLVSGMKSSPWGNHNYRKFLPLEDLFPEVDYRDFPVPLGLEVDYPYFIGEGLTKFRLAHIFINGLVVLSFTYYMTLNYFAESRLTDVHLAVPYTKIFGGEQRRLIRRALDQARRQWQPVPTSRASGMDPLSCLGRLLGL